MPENPSNGRTCRVSVRGLGGSAHHPQTLVGSLLGLAVSVHRPQTFVSVCVCGGVVISGSQNHSPRRILIHGRDGRPGRPSSTPSSLYHSIPHTPAQPSTICACGIVILITVNPSCTREASCRILTHGHDGRPGRPCSTPSSPGPGFRAPSSPPQTPRACPRASQAPESLQGLVTWLKWGPVSWLPLWPPRRKPMHR